MLYKSSRNISPSLQFSSISAGCRDPSKNLKSTVFILTPQSLSLNTPKTSKSSLKDCIESLLNDFFDKKLPKKQSILRPKINHEYIFVEKIQFHFQ
jgi:hypothetical protein